ncbi:MAG: MFS transporter [Burkholderiales bacterium]|nr:MFS transporter [Burkholderiales bacterium]
MLRILAFLLFSQPAGVMADRIDRKRILIGADLIRFALLAVFPFVDSVWQIYALIFAINAVTAFFTPTFEATLPDIVGSEHYVKALSVSRIGRRRRSRCRAFYAYRSGDANMRSVWLLCSRNDAIGNIAVVFAAIGVAYSATGWPDLAVAAVMGVLSLTAAKSVVAQARGELAAVSPTSGVSAGS